MKLVLKNTSGETVSLFVHQQETFSDLKKRVQDEVGISLDLQDLTIKGRTITDSLKVIEYFTTPETSQMCTAETSQMVEEQRFDTVSVPVPEVKCEVPTCGNTNYTCPEKAFFNFPMERTRCHQWALYCQRLNEASGKHRISITTSSVICSDHFRKDQFVKNTSTLLKRTAVPCLNPELPVSSSDVLMPRRRHTGPRPILPNIKPEPLTITLPLATLESALTLLQPVTGLLTAPQVTTVPESENAVFCRLCSNASTNVVCFYDEIGLTLRVAEKINSCLPIIVKDTDPLPKQVCRTCLDKLNLCYEVAETSVKAEQKLKNMMTAKKFSSQPLPGTDLLNPVLPPDLGLTQESLVNTPDNTVKTKSFYCCPLCSCGKMFTKSGIYRAHKESCKAPGNIDESCQEATNVDSLPELDTNKDAVVDHQLSFESVQNPSEKIINKPNEDQSHLWNGHDMSLKIPELDMDTLYNDPGSIVGMELDTIPEDEPWEGVQPKKEPKVIVKGEKDSLVCRLCGIEFSESTALMDHSEDHADVECFPCTVCEELFTDKSSLDSHFVDKHFNDTLEEASVHQCECCGLAFKSALRLETHNCGNSSASNRCRHCNKSFRSEARLEFHQKFHQGAKPGYCDICQKTFPDELKLYKHTMYLHSQNKAHCCEECGRMFKSHSSLKYHQRTHLGDESNKPYPCEYCGKCFLRKSTLRNHFLNTHKDKTQETNCFTCKICLEAFPSTDHAVNHMDIMHMPECSGETTYSFELHTVKRLYLCEYCERCYTDPNSLNNHREQHPVEFPYQCKLCNEAFSSSVLLEEHRKLHLQAGFKDYITEYTVPTNYICEFCERCFLSSQKLSEHLTIHFGEEPYHCRHCDMKFKTHSEAASHRLIHDETMSPSDDTYRPFECHYCPKSFSIEDALVKHIRMHTGEKPFICDQCGKGFSQSSGLYTHQKVHSNERPYTCPMCPRTFKIKGDRDVHVRKHSGDRPYKCDFCGKAFMTQHVFSQHRRIHTGERPYRCDVCGIAFRRSHVLTVHKRIHTGEKPNVCDICGKRYRQKGDMLKHRRLIHGIVKVRIQKIEF